MNELNERERAVYDYIVEVIRDRGYSPSVRDIQGALSINSTSTVHSCLERLEKKGYIQKEQGKSRTLRTDSVVGSAHRTVRVPLVGQVRAGTPILAVENFERYIDFPVNNRSQLYSQLFALKVKGDSMIEAGILEGDIIIVQKGSFAENGDIVVALIDEEATVKTFYKEKGHFRLQPENSALEPIITDDLYLLGKVISVMRFYD